MNSSQGKRLIGKGLAAWPPLREKLKKGTIVIAKGTTNRYVAEEILGESLADHRFAWGLVAPPGTKRHGEDIDEIVIVDGERRHIEYTQAVDSLSPGDLYIKGGNALHYPSATVGILSSSKIGGTIGYALPRLIGSRVRIVIPIGLEKCVAGPIDELAAALNDPGLGQIQVSTMYPVRGKVFTEIEALEVLTGLKATHVASGGVLGYEGAVRLIVSGSPEDISRIEKIQGSIKDEPPYDFPR